MVHGSNNVLNVLELLGTRRSANEILSLIVLFIVFVFKVEFVILIPTSYTRSTTYQLQRSTTEHSSACKSHSHNPQQASTYQLQRSATEHSSTCKSHTHKPQPASTYQL
jgi:cytoskeletal protein RodZ